MSKRRIAPRVEWLPGSIGATNQNVKQNAGYRGEMASRFASDSGPAVNTLSPAAGTEAFNLIHLIHALFSHHQLLPPV